MKSTAGRWPALIVLTLLALVAGAFAQEGAGSVPAARQADDVVVITVRGEIDRWTELSVKRRLAQAEESGADAVVIEIDSPGGEVGAVLEICNAIKGSTITNTVAWVHPDAYSGGAIIALACREIVTSSPASMGDAFPITFGPMGVRGLSPDERTKFLPPLLTEVADSARRSGYDEFVVQAMVVDGIELWSVKDADTGRLWFINEAEYRVLFEGDPPRGKPVLTSVTGGRASTLAAGEPAEAPSESEAESESGAAGDGQAGEGEAPASAAPPATQPGAGPADRDTAFTPASPSVADLASAASEGLGAASTRPVFTAGDRGRFVDPVYICDGTGPIVLRDDQLRQFGFSAALVQNDDQLRAYFGAKRMIRTEQTWSESMVRFLMHPVVRGVLIVILLLGLFVEMSSPGMILPGALAVGALLAILAPPLLVGMAGWWELLALAAGILCLMVELLVLPGFGVFGVIGLVALFVGLVGTFIPDGSGGLFGGDQQAQTGLLFGVVTVLLSSSTAGVLMFLLGKHFGTLPLLNRLILDASNTEEESELAAMAPPEGVGPFPGDRGVAASPLRPSGRALVRGQMVDAIAQRGYVDEGVAIEVVERRGFSWVVRPALRGEGESEAEQA